MVSSTNSACCCSWCHWSWTSLNIAYFTIQLLVIDTVSAMEKRNQCATSLFRV
jgi:hypothetical protein